MGSYDSQHGFRTIQSFVPDYCPNRVTQYESERTGMRVIVVDQEGPKLNGFFTLATEIHDDSGAPHTLEHLCFMGSKSYRYKGFLDKLATRAYSSTNAWTATDHTAYTLDTAGWAGFRQILPVYLEHVILPTLTDAGCLTEVHHIDGNGLDAGVVYSEMQGVQNTASELMSLKAKQLLYAQGVGFRYETGGMMEPLRVLTADRIRQFHRDMYQPKNLCVALFGELNHDELLETLGEFEDSIVGDIPNPEAPFTRPWIESKPVEPLTKTTIETVEFPEDDESMGQVDIYFLGPNIRDTLEIAALNAVLLYLAGSPAALLDNTIVEKEQLASGVYYNSDNRPRSEIAFSLSGVETEKLQAVEKRFFEVLKEAMTKDLDMDFMKDCIERQVRSVKFLSETNMTAFADTVISDYLFGRRDGSTLGELSTLKWYSKDLVAWSEKQWKDFMNKYIIDAHHVSIIGKPSAELSKKLKQDEAIRIEEQVKRLGPAGLADCAKKLEAAKAENDKEIPPNLLSKFPVPSTSSIHFVTTSAARAGPALKVGRPSNKYQPIIDEDAKDMPLFIDFEHIPSNFVRIHLLMSTENIPVELRPLLSIYLEAFFNLPIKRDGKVIDFEAVVQELERETVGYDIDTASNLSNTECLRIAYQVEAQNYQFAIKSISEVMYSSIFDVERLKAIVARLLADVPDAKRSGDSMLTAAHLMVHLAPESISRAKTTLTQALYLKRIKYLLKTDPDRVVEMFEKLRTSLCQYGNFRLNIIADLEKLSEPVSSWNSFVSLLNVDPKNPPPLNPLGTRRNRVSEAGKNLGSSPSMIIPMATIDSSYANAVTSGPTSYVDPSLPALIVAMAYMNAVEGPLWVAVRGTGLAYGTNMSYDVQSGFVYLDVYRSPDAYKAYQASHDVIKGHIDGTIPFDPLMLEGAISSVVVGFANEQATLASAAAASFVREIIKELPSDHTDTLLAKVKEVTVDQIKDILDKVVFDLFRPEKADVLVTCAVGLKEQIEAGLQKSGFKTQVKELTWFQDDYGLKDGEGEEGDDEEQAEDGEDGEEEDDEDKDEE